VSSAAVNGSPLLRMSNQRMKNSRVGSRTRKQAAGVSTGLKYTRETSRLQALWDLISTDGDEVRGAGRNAT